ncbi:MAG: ATP-dependent Clp protease adaptor ClpS [Bacteroidota bacterium]|nr:ATP-dependent Clp protease adaptor ClpS [Bacteroidota bacterium]
MKQTRHSSKNKKISDCIKELVLYNDDYNTFDHVIDCLEIICDHEILQAEQCALFTHHQGCCVIKKGKSDELESYKQDLISYGLNVQIV